MDPTVDNSELIKQLMGGVSALNPFGDVTKNPNYVSPYATPTQLAADRAYANTFTAHPLPVHRWTQGLANMSNAMIGGYQQGDADRQQQASYASDVGSAATVADLVRGQANASGQSQPAATAADDAGAPDASNNSTATQAKSFYEQQGLSPVAAAGLAGGFANEGGPTSVNKGDGADGSDSIGAGQWNGTRAQSLLKFAADNNLDPKALRTQLQFSMSELNGPEGKTLASLQAAQTPRDAAIAAAGYERPAGWTPNNPTGARDFDKRLAATNSLLAASPGAGGGGAPGAIAAATPQAPANALSPSASAYAGPQTGTQPTTNAPNNSLLASMLMNPSAHPAARPDHSDLVRQLQARGGPSQQPSANALAVAHVLASPYLGAEAKDVAKQYLVGSLLPNSYGGYNQFRPGDTSSRNVQQGTHFGAAGVGNQTLPYAVKENQEGPPTVTPIAPSSPTGAPPTPNAPGPRGAPGGAAMGSPDPLAGWRPAIAAGQQVSAEGTAKEHAAAGAGDQYQHDRAVAGNYAQSVAPLVQAIPALEALDKTGTGPTSGNWQQFKSTLQTLGIPGLDADKIDSYDKARGLLRSYVTQQGGTGALVGAFGSNPTNDMSNATATDLAKSALALQRAQQAKVLAFQRMGLPESAYPNFALRYSSEMDPRAFAFDHMSKEAKARLNESMPNTPAGNAARAKFNNTLKSGIATGMIPTGS